MATRHRDLIWLCVLLLYSAAYSPPATAQPRESSDPIGGITFEPPRRALIRHKSGQVIRGFLVAVSPDLVHVRLNSGKEFHYEIRDIRSIATSDKEFRYITVRETYREAAERATGLTGVTIEAVPADTSLGSASQFPQPPPPPMPVMVDSPNNYEIPEIVVDNRPATNTGDPAQPAQIPAIPRPVAGAVPQTGTVPAVPFYETEGFKIAFLIGCFAIILLWWRNRVG
jgi:hypothetical protein